MRLLRWQQITNSFYDVEILSTNNILVKEFDYYLHEVANQAKHSHNQVIDMHEGVEHFKIVGDAVLQGSMETHDISLKMSASS